MAQVAGLAKRGRLVVVGIGPGEHDGMSARARRALEEAEVIVGYHGYLDLIRPWLKDKILHGSPIGEELIRCRLAIALANQGNQVALVSSGDAGIYGVAGIIFELLQEQGESDLAALVEVVPGVSAAQAAAALLGAPLMSDYAVISLSDLLTPWKVIEQRLEAAASSDMVVALYNPASQRRRSQLARARQIFLRYRRAQTPVGVVRNAGRAGESVVQTTLADLDCDSVDMLTTVIVGNSATLRVGTRIVTRRGYRI
jgi:precorrin-3B C17-methyltransferase